MEIDSETDTEPERVSYKAPKGKTSGETSEMSGETSEMSGETSEMSGETSEASGEASGETSGEESGFEEMDWRDILGEFVEEDSGDEEETKISFPEFDTLPVSTKTNIAITNFSFNLANIFEHIEVYEKGPVMKGSIMTVKFQSKVRGQNTKNTVSFLNTLSISIIMEPKKMINCKLSPNGTIHITGCKKDNDYCLEAIYYLYEKMVAGNSKYSFYEQDDIGFNRIVNHVPVSVPENVMRFTLTTVMKNVNFSLGFDIDRAKLHAYLESSTDFFSTFDPNWNNSCNIKFPCKKFASTSVSYYEIYPDDRIIFGKELSITDILDSRMKKKDKYSTFLVFASGKCIMSSSSHQEMKEHYETFMRVILKHRKHYE